MALRWLSLNSRRRNTKLSEEEKGIPLRIYHSNICRSCLAVEATTSPGRCLDCGTSSSLLASTFVLPRGRNGLVPCIGPESDYFEYNPTNWWGHRAMWPYWMVPHGRTVCFAMHHVVICCMAAPRGGTNLGYTWQECTVETIRNSSLPRKRPIFSTWSTNE